MRCLALCLALVPALYACHREVPRPNLLLVSIDTLRADRLGSYGYASAETPRLDALAARGWRFADASTVVPLTLPAHSSLLTGTFPAHHGVRDNGGFYLGEEQATLAETLKAEGYRTGGFVGSFVLDRRWGIAQGFDRYFDEFDLSKYDGVGMDVVQRRGDEVVEQAERWLGADTTTPFFAWVHLYDPHTPYDAPEPFRSRHPQDIAGAYDAEIAWTDSLVGRLLDGLASRGALDRTIVIVVGDHGESLGAHGEQTHGFFIYEDTLHIPLLVSGPSVGSRTVSAAVRIVDVMPTALDLLGIASPPAVQGRSLAPLGRGERLDLVPMSETWYPRFHYGWSELMSIRDGRYKLIRAPRRELYDLERDPHETADLAAAERGRADTMERALTNARQRVTAAGAARAPQAVDPEVSERLEALGYLGGGISAAHMEDGPRGDPKDKIELYALLKSAGQASLEGRLDEAIARVRRALARDPGIVEGYTLLGNFHGKAQRWDEAVAAYKKALALDPEHQGAIFSLALAYKNEGRFSDAEAGFERARVLDPRNTKAAWQLADLWMRDKQYARAEAVLQDSLAKSADRPPNLVKLGECYLEMKRPRDAARVLEEALAARPSQASAHFNLALAREELGDLEGARRDYEAELALNSGAYRASFNLGRLLLRAGLPREARQRFADAVRSNPAFGTGHLYLAKAQLDAGDLPAALESARLGLARAPDRATAPLGHYVLADVYTRMGRPRDAARAVAAARRLEAGG